MLQYKLKTFYKDFSELKKDIFKIYPNSIIQDDYFKIFVLHDEIIEKLNIHHTNNKLEIVK